MPGAGIGTAAAIGAAGSLIGGIAGGTGSKGSGGSQTQNTSQMPPSWQTPYMQQGLGDASNLYSQEQTQQLPGGDWAAPANGEQTTAQSGLYNYGSLAGSEYTPWSQAGMQSAYSTPQYLQNATGLSTNGLNSVNSGLNGLVSNYAMTGQMPGTSQVNPALAQGITGMGMSGEGSIGQGNQIANQVSQNSLNPNNAMNAALTGASAYSNNPTLTAAINSANTDVNRELTENTLPQIQQAAMSSGDTNSSREGALEAQSTSMAQQNMLNNAANMTNAAYNEGGQLGEQGYLSGQQTALGGANALNYNGSVAGNLMSGEQGMQQQQNQFGVNSQIGAANNNLNMNLNAMLGGESALGNGLNIGMNESNTGLNGELSGLTAAEGAGTFTQGQSQNQINAMLNQFQAGMQLPQQELNNYWGVVGKPLGSQSTGATSNNGSSGIMGALQGGIGGGLAGYGLGQKFFGSGNGSASSNGVGGQLYNYANGQGGNTYNLSFTPSQGYTGGFGGAGGIYTAGGG